MWEQVRYLNLRIKCILNMKEKKCKWLSKYTNRHVIGKINLNQKEFRSLQYYYVSLTGYLQINHFFFKSKIEWWIDIKENLFVCNYFAGWKLAWNLYHMIPIHSIRIFKIKLANKALFKLINLYRVGHKKWEFL